ncbi:MAG: hypothetical protein ACP5OO_10020 [Chloroflexia bacterium]
MALNDDKLALAYQLVNSLSKQQKAQIGELLAKTRSETLEAAIAELAQALESGGDLTLDVPAIDSLQAELAQWKHDMEAGLATILSLEQYALYLDSLLPAPAPLLWGGVDTKNDCYYAYYYGYYGNYYAYYFYLYAYYTYQSADDPYTYLVFSLSYSDYRQSYYGYAYAYYAYYYYYHSTYAYYAYYYTRHAEGTSLYGTYMAYILYTWTTSNPYSYNAYVYAAYSYNYITVADNYAYACYATLGGQAAPRENSATLDRVGGLQNPAFLPKFDPTEPPLPEGVSRSDLAMTLDSQKAQATIEWVRSLTPEQQDQVRAAVFAQGLPYLHSRDLKPENIEAIVTSLVNWQNAMAARLSEILTPEQYQQYQASLLPPPSVEFPQGIESQTDCYYAYYYNYYGYVYSYYYYLYAYYTYTTYQQNDPYVLDNYLFGYYSYLYSYYGYLYAYYAYANYYSQTYGYYAFYYTRHAEGFSYYGFNFAYMTYTWLPYTYPYYAYAYGYYNFYYITIGDDYAWDCYNEVPGFDSQFNGSAEGWEANYGTWYVSSSYLWTYGVDADGASASYYLAEYANFDYQARVRRATSYCTSCANRLWVRGDVYPMGSTHWWNSAYVFQYAQDGYYSVYKVVNGTVTALRSWTYTSAIYQGTSWNTLRVVANGSSLYFYINGTLVWSGSDSSLTSGRVGVGLYDDDTFQVDWAKLTNYGATGAPPITDPISPDQRPVEGGDFNHGPGYHPEAPTK